MNRDRPRNGWNGRPKPPKSGWGRPGPGRGTPPGRPRPPPNPAAPTAILSTGDRAGPPAGRAPGYGPAPGAAYDPHSRDGYGPPPGAPYNPHADDGYGRPPGGAYGSPPARGAGSGRPPGRPPRPAQGPRRRRGLLKPIAALLALALLGFGVYVDTQLSRVSALKGGNELSSEGTNWLIVGSDSRADLSSRQERQYATGDTAGQRTDTIMLLHSGSSGTVLVSLPRDSLLSIPGHGKNKLNAAYSFGGPTLLVRTVEQATGLQIDHYAEIGLGGFVQVVDAVGGVDMCLDQAIRDPLAGIKLKAGCQELNGEDALGYVRTRATPRADLDRIEHQREFLSALMKRMSSPTTFLNPFRLVALVNALPGAMTVDSGDHVWHLLGLGLAMRSLSGGDGIRTTVPISGLDNVNGSSVVRWDSTRAKALFGALAKDKAVPKSALG